MKKINKFLIIALIAISYIVISIFDIVFGSLSLLMNVIRAPFKALNEFLIRKAEQVNAK
jgi:hypothetical protein